MQKSFGIFDRTVFQSRVENLSKLYLIAVQFNFLLANLILDLKRKQLWICKYKDLLSLAIARVKCLNYSHLA